MPNDSSARPDADARGLCGNGSNGLRLSDGSFSGRSIVVTGASSGIGAAICTRLAAAGGRMIAVARHHGQLVSATAGLGNVELVSADVSELRECRRLAARVDAITPHLDHLVVSSGSLVVSRLEDTAEEEWDSVIGTNLKGPFFLVQSLIPALRRGSGKSIVVLSSSLAHSGAAGLTVYCASKGGLSSLVRAMAVELAPSGIRVNAVSPGHVDTPMIRSLMSPPQARRKIEEQYPLGRIGTPDDVAELVLFLLSRSASWITGVDYVIDGGRLAAG